MHASRFLFAAFLVGTLAACPAGKGIGGHGLPGSDKVPGGLGGASGEVDPNTCGNYAVSDAGRKFKAFLEATMALEKQTEESAQLVAESCRMIGRDLGMGDDDFKGETKDICAKVWGQIKDNMKVSFKAGAKLDIKYKPAVCRIDVDVQAKAAAECEGHANADVGAKCEGECHGTCDGKCSGKAGTGGNSGQCDGECSGSCHGECSGHADVDASAQCKANASVQANASMKCEPAELTIDAKAGIVLDKTKAEMTLKALRDGVPQLLSVKARMAPIKYAAEVWAQSAKELKDMGPKFVNSFGDQALCIAGQVSAAFSAIGHIQANVDVSVSVSAEASGSIGG